jgi:hypothetical protein
MLIFMYMDICRAAQINTELSRTAQGRKEMKLKQKWLQKKSRSPQQPRAAQSSPEQPRAAQSSPEQPRAVQSSPEELA